MSHQKATQVGRILILSLFLVTSILTSASFATPIDVSYLISGSVDNWILNFSVTNNLVTSNLGNNNMIIYLFGVNPLGAGDRITGSPDQWDMRWLLTDPNNKQYNYAWHNLNDKPIPGSNFIFDDQTLSGFSVLDTEPVAPTSVNWIAYATIAAPNGTYTGSDPFFNTPDNPIFEGIAKDSPTALPEPSTFLLITAGLVGVGLLRRKILINHVTNG